MTRHEKLILFLIALVMLGRFGHLARDLYIASHYGPIIPADVKEYWRHFSFLFGVTVNVGAAIWLYIEAQALSLRAWIWALLGLFFGLVGLVLFYLIQVFSRREEKLSADT